jgi:hypothetical protein
MMRAPPAESGSSVGSATASLSAPAVVVVLVLLLGATIYLWRARYMRRRTAYVTMGVLAVALILFGLSMYSSSV